MTADDIECFIEAFYDLLAAVFKRALLDARRGDQSAIGFLTAMIPDWRARVGNG